MNARRAWLAAGTLGVTVAGVALAVILGRTPAVARREVSTYLAAWSKGDVATMAGLVDAPPADFAAVTQSVTASAPGSRMTFTVSHVGRTTATFHAHVDVGGFGPLDWDGSLPLVRVHGRWLIHWVAADLFPGLTGDQHLVLHRTWPARAPILGDDGTALVSEQDAVTVGLEPDHINDVTQVQTALSSALGVAPAAITSALAAPGVRPSYFVPVVTIRRDKYGSVHDRLVLVPGIMFRRTQARLPAVDGLAPQVLGAEGEITRERLSQLGPPYQVGDQVGLSGLEAVYETRLAGRPSGEVDIDEAGKVIRSVQQYPGVPPQPVQITLDSAIQQAAQAAVAGTTHPAALVAIDAATGDLRAVVSAPTDQPFDRALDGSYPPGSTFKIVTTTALLSAGRTPSTAASCPPALTVDGRRFTNFEGEAPGAITLARAFAISCNTAFIGLADQLAPGALSAAATSFGFGRPEALPLTTIGGTYPTPADQAETAASAIGQARVTVSPLHMATVAAAVDSGQWRPPELMLQPAPPPAPSDTVVAPLDPAVAATVRSLMALVITGGTGTAAAVRGEQIFGKTGTAEFGNATPPSTHAWFVGFRGGLAFAVIVEDGGVGGTVAAPLAARFLAAVPQ